MFSVVEKSIEQVKCYSTYFGQLWYAIVFLFRLIVVVTIGSSVYSDEQSAFRCSTKIIGCENVCYNRFARISHMRFWAFQILALSIPVVAFHFYTSFVQEHLERMNLDKRKKDADNNLSNTDSWKFIKEDPTKHKKNVRRRKLVGKVEERHRLNKDNELKTIYFTSNIRTAYLVSAIVRFAIEFLFLYFAFILFHFATYTEGDSAVVSDGEGATGFFNLFWIRVPQLYRCSGESVEWACSQHLLPGSTDPYVPCWVSRAEEKTIFLCYMNTLSVICLLLCLAEIFLLSVRMWKQRKQNKKEKLEKERGQLDDSQKKPSNMTACDQQYVTPIENHDDATYHKPLNPSVPHVNSWGQMVGAKVLNLDSKSRKKQSGEELELSNPNFRGSQNFFSRPSSRSHTSMTHINELEDPQEQEARRKIRNLHQNGVSTMPRAAKPKTTHQPVRRNQSYSTDESKLSDTDSRNESQQSLLQGD